MKNKSTIIAFVIILIAVFVGMQIVIKAKNTPGKYDTFTKCLADKGAVFYGAFWCSHCQAQKKEFGKSAKLLPYVECSTPNGQDQLDICKAKEIKGYPTWIFADGSRLTGEIPLAQLAEKTSCELPKEGK